MPELAHCDVCGSDASTPFLRRGALGIVRCLGCGVHYTSPRLTAAERAELYSEGYFTNPDNGYGYTDYIREAPLHLLTAWRRLEEIEKRHAPGSLLEIGCAAGLSLFLARERGWAVRGLETSQAMVRFARERLGLDVRRFDAETENPEGCHDVILLDDVLEHLSSPRALVRRLRDHLAPGGMLALKTPNAAGLAPRLLGRRWFHFKPDEHLHFFDPPSMRRVLEQEGFARIEIRPASRMISWGYLLQRLGLLAGSPTAPITAFPIRTGEMAVFAWREPAG